MKRDRDFQIIVDSIPAILWTAHPNGDIDYCNQFWLDFTGLKQEETWGDGWKTAMHPDDVENTSRVWAEALKQGDRYEVEHRMRRHDGSYRWFYTRALPKKDESGRIIKWYGINVDITKRKIAEDEMFAAKIRAENASKTTARFLDIAAHELRTPVTSFIMQLQLAQKMVDTGKPLTSVVLARIFSQARRLARLVTDLFDMSHLEHGTMPLQVARTNMVALILDCLAEMRLVAPKRTFTFIPPTVSPETLELDIDAPKISQALLNLLNNAIKYTPQESSIEIKLEVLNERIRVAVVDHGPGISKQNQEKLFVPFARGSDDQAKQTKGLGLGLFVSRTLLELHGGSIWVSSEVGRGTTFYFELPMKGQGQKQQKAA